MCQDKISKALSDLEIKLEQYYISKLKKSKIGFAERLENEEINADPLKAMWRTLNIKRDAYLQILKMQQ